MTRGLKSAHPVHAIVSDVRELLMWRTHRPLPVGYHHGGACPDGAQDMVGNAWEWVADWIGDQYYARSPERNPQGPESVERRVWRGGSFTYHDWVARCAVRGRKDPPDQHPDGGFRVVVTPPDR